MKVAKVALLLVFLGTFLLVNAFGYEAEMHGLINQRIYTESVIQGSLQNDLDLPGNKILPNPTMTGSELKTPYQLFRDAGPEEDVPITRAWNHFHDPIKSWGTAGYTGLGTGISSILWSQGELASNEWTWGNAYSFFMAGISSASPSTRDLNLARMISALGHLTHLTGDMSVPEHTRNDGHFLYNYETWCEQNLTHLRLSPFRNAYGPDNAIFAVSLGQYGTAVLSPVSNLWDSTPQGGYYNPNMYINPRLVGLADYSNFNYFSGDTVFKDYQFPAWDESKWKPSPIIQQAKDGKYDNVLYFQGLTSDGVVVPHLAAAKMLYQEWIKKTVGQHQQKGAQLDPYCYQDYAHDLVPRAVSYGTALVNYFFRGRFNVTAQGDKLTIENLYRGEVEGTATIYSDDSNGVRTRVAGVDDLILRLGGAGTPASKITYAGFPGAPNVRYTLVFSGTAQNLDRAGTGTDNDAVVAGKAFSWTAPATTFPVAWRPPAPNLNLPATLPDRTHWWTVSCLDCHWYFDENMKRLDLCKSCHGQRAVGNPSGVWDYQPRIFVSPDAPPDWKTGSDVTTFNPKNGDTVSGLVQFVFSVFTMAHPSTKVLHRYRVEVRTPDNTLATCYPRDGWDYPTVGWQPASELVFLRNWTYQEALLWDSRTVPSGPYDFYFYPMSHPPDYGYPGRPTKINTPAVLRLNVQN